MRFEVLGPLRVAQDDGELLCVSRARQRNLLAVLLLHANQPLSPAKLAEMQCVRDTGRSGSALRTHIWQLRRHPTLADRLQTAQGGYLIEVEPGELDLDRFRELAAKGCKAVKEGSYDVAVNLLGQACALWRDPPLADLPLTLPMSQTADRLIEEWQVAEEYLTTARLARGEHRELLVDLRERVSADPLAEHSWEDLMLALYRSGRKVAALDAYSQARTILRDEYGLDPSPPLRRLHHQILAVDPALDLDTTPPAPVRPIPSELPADLADFTGRDEELAQLTEFFDVRSGIETAPCVAVITGSPGIGKTALAVHAAHMIRDRLPDGQLYADLGGTSTQPADPRDLLARLLHSLGVPANRIPASTSARSGLWRSVAAERAIMIVLDDAAAIGQVLPLLPGTGACAVLITSRSRLSGLPNRREFPLGPMPGEDAIGLMSRVVRDDRTAFESDAIERTAAECAGVPLALRIVGERLSDGFSSSLTDMAERLRDDRTKLDALVVGSLSARAVIAPSYVALPEPARLGLRLLALAPSSGLPRWGVDALLDEADACDAANILIGSSLLTITGPDPAGQLRHQMPPLVAEYVAEQSAPDATARLRTAFERLLAAYLRHARAVALPKKRLGCRDERKTHDRMTWYKAERDAVLDLVRRAAAFGLDDLAAELMSCIIIL